jgi:hypothetical protein
MSQNRPLRLVPPAKPQQADDDLLPLPKRAPLVAPGVYVGVTMKVTKRSWNACRQYLEIEFDLFPNAEALGMGEVPVARNVSGYFNLEGRRGPDSKYGRLLATLFPSGQLPRRLTDLVGKNVTVEVTTVQKSQVQPYSKVSQVLGPL